MAVDSKRPSWAEREVEASLIAAFRDMPSLPVFANVVRLQEVGACDQSQVTAV